MTHENNEWLVAFVCFWSQEFASSYTSAIAYTKDHYRSQDFFGINVTGISIKCEVKKYSAGWDCLLKYASWNRDIAKVSAASSIVGFHFTQLKNIIAYHSKIMSRNWDNVPKIRNELPVIVSGVCDIPYLSYSAKCTPQNYSGLVCRSHGHD